MTTVEITPASTVCFFDLRSRSDGEDVIVGRPDTGDFVQLPAIGWTIIEQLMTGASLGKVENTLAAQGMEVDAVDFVGSLDELGFVRSVDGIESPTAAPPRRASLAWIRPVHVRWLFHPLSYLAYALILTAAVLSLVRDPSVRPNYRDIFFSSSTSVVLLGTTALFFVIVALHETAHLVSARAADVPARISLGTRLYSLVAQTDVSGMWAASRRERMRTYLAGMATDLILASALVVGRASVLTGWANQVAAAAVVLVLVGIAGQFQLFMRTDVYFVVAELCYARNLFGDAIVLVLQTLNRWIGKGPGDALGGLSEREHRVVRRYAWVMVVGTVGALLVFAVYLLPALVVLLVTAAERCVSGIAEGDWLRALDGAATVLVEGGTQVLVVCLLVRSRNRFGHRIGSRMSTGSAQAGAEA